jgi:hypothetical protein
LGGERFSLNPDDKIFEKNANMFAKDKKIIVLGNLAPALFLPSLSTLMKNNSHTEDQLEMVNDQIFLYEVLMNDEDLGFMIQGMF